MVQGVSFDWLRSFSVVLVVLVLGEASEFRGCSVSAALSPVACNLPVVDLRHSWCQPASQPSKGYLTVP